MQVELVAAPSITVNPGNGRPWKKMEVLYRNEGKVQTKILVSFKNPTVFKIFAEAKQGDVFEVESVKGEPGADGKQYWEWKAAHCISSNGAAPQTGVNVVDTAGTPAKPVTKMIVTEADRNRYIVRQSSLERAIETLAGNAAFSKADVTDLAAYYERWVFRPVNDVTQQVAGTAVVGSVAGTGSVVSSVESPRKRGRPAKVAAPAGTENLDVDVE